MRSIVGLAVVACLACAVLRSPAAESFPPLVGDGVVDDTAAIQARLDSGMSCVYLPPPAKCYLISKTLKIGSNQELRLDRFSVVRLAPKSDCPMVENRGYKDGADKRVALTGGIWDMANLDQSPNPAQYRCLKPPRPSPLSKHYEYEAFLGIAIRFANVEGITVRGLTVRNPTLYGIAFCKTSYFHIDDISFDYTTWNPLRLNMDGVHFDGHCHHGKISNLRGTCYDDLVALNANDVQCAQEEGPISDVDIDGIYAEYCHSAVRLLSAGADLKRVTIRNVHGGFYTYAVGLTHYFPKNPRGHFDDIVISDVFASKVYSPEDIGVNSRTNYPPIWVQGPLDVGSLAIRNLSRDEKNIDVASIRIDEPARVKRLTIRDCKVINRMDKPLPFLDVRGKVETATVENNIFVAAPGENVQTTLPAKCRAEIVPAPREQVWRGGTCTFAEKDIRFVRDAAIPPEGYRLDITPGGVTVASADDAGAFYARRTLKQLGHDAVPCGTVTDSPAFKWRGLMLDEGRHFFGKETVKNLLDLMADHKLNVFHWHLTEDQGWRLDIARFPELVKYGSVRPESPVHGCRGGPKDYRGNGQQYGPYFYTADDVREILAYAKERFIAVVPEIEIPGHVRALLAAHPEFACREGLPRVPRTMNDIEDDVLCAGNDDAIRFMEQVYDEVCALFPGEYIHIGGDECPKKRWKECPKCQARIKTLGLKGEDGLQAWVTRHFTDYLSKKGRRAIGWDEVLAGNAGTETIVHNWRKPEYGIEAAEKGHDVVVSALRSTYFSVPQGVKDDPFTYLSPAWRCPLSKAYSFDPLAGMTDAAKRRVLGAECCMWSECVWNEYDLAFKLWPRACAFAEAVWTAPAEPRDYEGFKRRLKTHRQRLIASGVLCAPLE